MLGSNLYRQAIECANNVGDQRSVLRAFIFWMQQELREGPTKISDDLIAIASHFSSSAEIDPLIRASFEKNVHTELQLALRLNKISNDVGRRLNELFG